MIRMQQAEKAETKKPESPVALITGGTTGIGLATARVLHQRGFTVVVTGVDPDALAASRQILTEDALVLRANLRLLSDAERVSEVASLPRKT